MLFVFESAFADWGDPLDQMIGHFRFAFNAADARCAATMSSPIERFLWRKELVPVVDGANVWIARVGSALTGRIGDHHLGLLANIVVRFAQRDGVSVRLDILRPSSPGMRGVLVSRTEGSVSTST